MRLLDVTPAQIEEAAQSFVDLAYAASVELDPEAEDFIAQAAHIMSLLSDAEALLKPFKEAADTTKYVVGQRLTALGLDSAKTPSGSFYFQAPSAAAYVKEAATLRTLIDADPTFAASLAPFLTWGQRGGSLAFRGKK